jgi:hypothetical protein
MRVVALSMCLLAAACGSQEPGSPISPTSATPTGASQTAATKAAASLPFKGDISGTTMGVFTPPATLEIHLSGEGMPRSSVDSRPRKTVSVRFRILWRLERGHSRPQMGTGCSPRPSRPAPLWRQVLTT